MSAPADALRPVDPARRVVLLGASNLTRGISTIVETAREAWGRPLEVMAALGHGRSYALTSRVLMRTLPGILSCGLWDALRERPPLPTASLITDIGNDILYDASPEQIAGWVEKALQRLMPVSEKIVVTQLPLDSIARLSRRRFEIVRRIIFPSTRLTYKDAIQRATQLSERINELTARYEVPLIQQRGQWYGWDPIHIRLRYWPAAWREVLSTWCEDAQSLRFASASPVRWLRLRRLRPLRRTMFGIEQHRAQPAAMWRDGTSISLY